MTWTGSCSKDSLEWPLVVPTAMATSIVQQTRSSFPKDSFTDTAHSHVTVAADHHHHGAPYYQLVESQIVHAQTSTTLDAIHPGYGIVPPHLHPSRTEASRPPEISILSSTYHERIQVPFPTFNVTSDPLTFARHCLFANGLAFGFRFTSTKTQAILFGDLSSTIVRSACVHVSTLWGLALVARAQGQVPDVALQAAYHCAAHTSLQIPPTTQESAVDDIQARAALAVYDFNRQNLVAGSRWLREAISSIRQAELQFTLPTRTNGIRNDSTLYIAATAQDQERDALCYLVGVDLAARMLFNTKSSLSDDMQQSVAKLLVSLSLVFYTTSPNIQNQSHCDQNPNDASIMALRLMAINLLFEIPIAYRGLG
jgi:hypothetical protein